MSLIDSLLKSGIGGPGDTEWLHLLVGDWQIIADTAHGDLVLWFPIDFEEQDGRHGKPQKSVANESNFKGIAQVRPSTVHTLFHRDKIGQEMGPILRQMAFTAWKSQQIVRLVDQETIPDLSLNTVIVPLVRNSRTIALMTVHTEPFGARTPARVELVYRKVSEDLLQMVSRGSWPEFSAPVASSRGNPRVSDGLITLDVNGKVLFASPNASSNYKRLGFTGELEDQELESLTRNLLPSDEKADETLPLVLTGRMPWRAEIKAKGVSVTLRAIPLKRFTTLGEERFGALILCRDVTELRRRELELMTKDATIREIHHRVKNNLQTVSALLRMQSRRMTTEEAKNGLEQAMRRVSTIALVHETLSQGLTQTVDFDELIQRQFKNVAEVASPGQQVTTQLKGSFGMLPSQFATPLSLVINEVVANAVEHGLNGNPGTVTLESSRAFNEDGEPTLTVIITDDGQGMGDSVIEESGVASYRPPQKSEGLGMQIVRTLVASELNGSIRWEPADPHGTRVVIKAVLAGPRR